MQHLCTALQFSLEKLTAAASSHLNKPFFCAREAECFYRYAALLGRSDELRISWVWAEFNRLILYSNSLSITVSVIVFPLTLTERIAGMSLHSHRLFFFSVCVSFAWMCSCTRLLFSWIFKLCLWVCAHKTEGWKKPQSTTNIALTRSHRLCVLTSVWRLPAVKSKKVCEMKCRDETRAVPRDDPLCVGVTVEKDESFGLRGKNLLRIWSHFGVGGKVCMSTHTSWSTDWLIGWLICWGAWIFTEKCINPVCSFQKMFPRHGLNVLVKRKLWPNSDAEQSQSPLGGN